MARYARSQSPGTTRRLSLLGPALLLPALLAGVTYSGIAEAAMGISGKPKVSFFATGSPGALDIEGVTNTMTVTDDGTTIVFTVPMESVKSGIDMRDAHQNEKFVETAKFPNATLKVSRADVTWPVALAEESNGTVKATFNVHGQDAVVDVTYNLKRSKTGYRARASFHFDATQHGIQIPSYAGVTVDPKMHAEVNADLVDG